ncbi:MAG: NAD(P)-dependent oxidoreductase [Pseudomonadota bacterium]
MTERIALLGTGLMGGPMAQNLLKSGHELTVWNRTRAKADALSEAGARVADSAADAVRGADIVISMLSDGPATAAVQADPALRDALQPGGLWIEMGSIKPEEARAQASDLAQLDVGHLDAPVSGGTKGAEAGDLAIMAGGPEDAFRRAEPVLRAMGRPVHVGPSGAGELAKLANQAIVAITIGAVAEAMLLIEKGGGDPSAVRTALKGGFADSIILQQHGARMTDRNFVPGGFVSNQIKDLDNALSEAGELGLSLPATSRTRERFVRLMEELKGGELDHSALFLELLDRNRLTP